MEDTKELKCRVHSVAHIAETACTWSLQWWGMTGSLIREERVRISGKVSFFFLECINSPVFLSLWSSHFKKFTYCLNHCCFSTGPSHASWIFCLYFVLSLSPPLPEWRTQHTVQGCFGFASREDEAEDVQICWGMHQWCLQQWAAALPVLPLPSLQQTLRASLPNPLLVQGTGQLLCACHSGCWSNDSNILFWTMSCLA